jgi:hypothetical protein
MPIMPSNKIAALKMPRPNTADSAIADRVAPRVQNDSPRAAKPPRAAQTGGQAMRVAADYSQLGR